MSDRLIEIVEDNRAQGFTFCCMDGEHCERTPSFIVATPIGQMGFCDEHVSEIVAMLPQEWTEQWLQRPVAVIEDEIPF